ncbi:MAG: hemolysin family protein [Chitinophagales bacterium]|jgi:CBS domain containing-hemolysin-like protein
MEILSLALVLLLIAYFSGIEIAFISANKLRIELLKEKGQTRAKIVSEFNNNPSRFISTLLIGLNIALVLFGSMMARLLTPERFSFLPHDEAYLMIIETFTTTALVLLLGELIPKMLFRINADQMLLFFAYPTKYLVYMPLQPLSDLFHTLSRKTIKLIAGKDFHDNVQSFSQEDLEYLIKESSANDVGEDDETDDINSEIFEKALYLKEVKLKACMVPRPEVEAIEVSETLADLRKLILDTKHSRIPVYQKTIDSIIGYVYHLDLLKNPATIREIIRPIEMVPSSMNAQDLLVQLIKERKNMSWVVDEYGGTAGIITLEDLMEQIFGEIEDEHDVEEMIEKKINDTEFVFSARLEITYLNEEYSLSIPEGDYHTLAGYIVTMNEDIPDQNDVIQLGQYEVKILKASNKRIDLVRMKVNPQE